MQLRLLALAVLSSAALAAPGHEKRQATDPGQFSSAVDQLVSLYIPPSVGIPLGAAVQSAASASGVTGDINAIIQSALAATTPPAYLTAVPSQYQPNLVSLEAAISALRGVASSGIPGAPVISVDSAGSVHTTGTKDAVTTTDASGSTIVGVTGPITNSAGSTFTSLTKTLSGPSEGASSGASSGASQPSGAVVTTDSAGSTITGLAVTTTNSAGSTETSLTTTFPAGSSATLESGSSVSSTESSGSSTESSGSSSSGSASSTSTSTSTSTSGAVTTTSSTSTSTTAESSTSQSSSSSSGSSSSSAAPASTSSKAAAPAALAPGAGGILGLLALALAL